MPPEALAGRNFETRCRAGLPPVERRYSARFKPCPSSDRAESAKRKPQSDVVPRESVPRQHTVKDLLVAKNIDFSRANNTRTSSTDVRPSAILLLHQLPDCPHRAGGLGEMLPRELGTAFGLFFAGEGGGPCWLTRGPAQFRLGAVELGVPSPVARRSGRLWVKPAKRFV